MPARKSLQQKAQVHKIQKLYQGDLFSFVVEDVTLPNGSRSEMAMVRHPGSTAVVPLSDDNMVVMERQYRYAVHAYLLEVPAGTMEPGEAPLECVRRELEEETGFVAAEFVELGKIHILPGYSDELLHMYLATGLVKSRQNLDSNEIIEVVQYPLDDALRMIGEGRITDGVTILCLQRAHRYLQNKEKE